ncbi:MAG: hypothetical protein MUC59_10955 [Saprospiraceae bacterium]|nr:hypothetical protein [Saprospiraceae bacterium]
MNKVLVNKVLVNKVLEFRNTQSDFGSPDVWWDEFEADYADRSFLETRMNRILSLVERMGSAKTQFT